MKASKYGFMGMLAAVALVGTGCPGGDPNNGDGGTDGGNGFEQPENTVALNFTVDATGRADTYQDGDLEWKGSYVYDEATRTIVKDTSWPGPFPPLYDDGPWTTGGHEPVGNVAGDDKFGVTVFFAIPTEETTLNYGLQTKEAEWIWPGTSDGTIVIPANATAAITAEGAALAPFGDVDVKVTLDTTALEGDHTEGTGVKIKGTFTGWTDVVLADDGATLGDATADDNEFTYVLSEDGERELASSGSTEEWVFVVNDTEYKGTTTDTGCETGNPLKGGVTVYTKGPSDTDWVEQTIIRAGNCNTAVEIP